MGRALISLAKIAVLVVPRLCHVVPLDQWFLTFLRLQTFNMVLLIVVTPTLKLFSLLLHNNFVIVINSNVISDIGPHGVVTQRLRNTA